MADNHDLQIAAIAIAYGFRDLEQLEEFADQLLLSPDVVARLGQLKRAH